MDSQPSDHTSLNEPNSSQRGGSGEIHAWHYKTGKPICIQWQNGHITALSDASGHAPKVWVAPSLVDLQVNGFAKVDFQQDSTNQQDLESAVRGLLAAGCTRFFPTFISDRWQALMARTHGLIEIRKASTMLGLTVAGVHLEGPFVSAEPGFRGAHDATVMCDPDQEQVEALKYVASMLPLMLTVAPERVGMENFVKAVVDLGARVSLGHTNASAAQINDMFQAGARGFTHLGNGCPQSLDRHDNILWRVLDHPSITVSLIPDAIHVSPVLFRLIHRLLHESRIYYTADPMAAAGAPPGRYSLRDKVLEVGKDRVVRLPGQTNFAGSALEPIEGIRRAAAMLGQSWQTVWDHYSTFPAAFAGLRHGLETGCRADFCLITQNLAEPFELASVYLNGQQAVNGKDITLVREHIST